MNQQNKEWAYIIQRNGFIVELRLDADAYQKTLNQWTKGDLLMVKSMNGKPMGINATDVVNILLRDDYEMWIDSANPARYIRRGMWYTRDNRTKSYRIEPWKQTELDEQKKLEAEEDITLTPEERVNSTKRMAEMRKKLGYSVDL